MERTDKKWTEALDWLRYVLNSVREAPTVKDWMALIGFAEKQSITGIFLPETSPDNIDKELLLQWIGETQLIEQQNILLNKRVEQLFEMLEHVGMRCCLLKGQGNAMMYPNPLMRCSGDIDVWIDADEEKVYQYVKNRFPDAEVSFKHIHFPIFEDAPVDVHITPLRFYSGLYEKRLQRWIDRNKEEQFSNKIRLSKTQKDICVPTGKFNVVYQLGHMLIHLFDEGLGLRQVVDYFFVLTRLNVTEKERRELADTIEDLGMLRFAKGIMWIEHEVLGLPIEKCIVELEEKRGVQLLDDILEGGNFGHYSERYNGKSGFYYRGLVESRRVMSLLPIAPIEGTAKLFSKMGTAIRKLSNR